MSYKDFALDREPPIHEADWLGEFEELRQRALGTIALAIGVVGYVWSLAVALLMHPDFAWAPIVLPISLALLGSTMLIIQRPLRLRRMLFVVGILMVGAIAVFGQRAPAAPFVYVVATLAAPLVSGSLAALLSATSGSLVVLAASRLLPGQYPAGIVSGAVVLCWTAAIATWLTWRNLHTVLEWALREYELSRQVTKELQVQRGKLNRTMKDLADANLLLKRTTHDLAEMSEEAERARQVKSQFAANISHELRTPLHLIVGFSQMMHTSPDTYRGVTWTPELQGDIQEVYESAQQLLRLIDDVLDLSQVEAARLPINKEETDLAPLVIDAVDTARSLLRDRNLYLRTELPQRLPHINVDPTRIRQVLLNLLNNASRFTEEGGITVGGVLHEDEVEFTVADTGIGIPPEQLSDIFTEFYQVDNTLRRRYGGTGLGLSICKQFVALHDGRIWAESEVGRGSRFHFTLPLPNRVVVESQRSQRPTGWRYPSTRPAHRRLVTLSQPPEFPRVLRRYLTGVEMIEASDAAEAATLARQHQADAIVISPEMGDGQLMGQLAEATASLWLPVIACSLPLERHGALAEGFSDCLMKPFTSDQLVRLLHQIAPTATKLLVVDDDPGVLRLVSRATAAALPHLTVLVAGDVHEATTFLDERPDVVLLDLILRDGHGLALLRDIRERPWGLTLPVVAITAYGFQQEVGSLRDGLIAVRRGRQFTAAELTHWLDGVLDSLPARHVVPAS